MALIGLKKFVCGVLTEAGDSWEYGAPMIPGKAVSCSVSITNNSGSLYADDALAESDTSFQSGTVSLTLDNADLEIYATLLGHSTGNNGEIVRNAMDVAPYVGMGRVVTLMVGGVYKYRVEFLRKVKFSEPSQDNNTKGETLEFGTPTLEGTVATLANGDWSDVKEFEEEDDAIEFLYGYFEEPSE